MSKGHGQIWRASGEEQWFRVVVGVVESKENDKSKAPGVMTHTGCEGFCKLIIFHLLDILFT